MGWFRRLLTGSAAPAALEPVQPPPAPARRSLKVTAQQVAQLAPRASNDDVFAAAPIPKGVAPAGAMAMDYDIGSAASSAYDFRASEGLGFFGYPILAEMAQRAEYRMITEKLAGEMTRKWITLTSTADDDDAMSEKLEQLGQALEDFKVRDVFRKAVEHDGFFGRGQIYIDVGASDAEKDKPLIADRAKIAKGGLKALKNLEPIWTYPNRYNSNDPLADDFYKPTSWFVMGKSIDASRLLTFVGRPVPDMLKPAYAFGGLSMTQMAKPYVDNWLRTRQSVSDLLHAFSTMVLKTDLSSLLEAGATTDLTNRLDAFNRTRDNRGVFVCDNTDEDIANLAVPLGTLDKLQAQSQEHMASVSNQPLVILLGLTPSGLNASTDGEFRAFYAWIHSRQEALFTAPLRRVLDILQLHLWGEIVPEIGFEFVPLWQMDEVQAATVRKTNADTDVELINAGVLHPEESRRRVAREEGSGYNDIDVSDVPEPPADPADEEGDDGDDGGPPSGGAADDAGGWSESDFRSTSP